MKKLIVMAISLGMMVIAVGCSSKNVGSGDTPNTSENPQVTVSPEGDSSNSGQAMQGEIVFGKVKSLVGNEIELDVAKPQMFVGEEGQLPMDGEELPMADNQVNVAGSAIIGDDGTVTMNGDVSVSDQPLGELQGSGSVSVGEGSQGSTELEYTGETKKITIPAGAVIFDMNQGKEVKLSEIKEGSILNVVYSKNGDTMVVERIDIIE